MAIATDRNLRQTFTVSMYSRSEGVRDLVYDSAPITVVLRERGVVRAYDDGPEIRAPLLIDKLQS